MAKQPPGPPRLLNRKARHEFEILEDVEAGIALTGSEVKSLRSGRASLDEAYAYIDRDEAWLRDFTIQPYEQAGYSQHEPKRPRKLLLHRREIRKWTSKVVQRGFTLVPLAVYFNERGIVKVQIALARGKNVADKRESIKKRDQQRDIDRALRRR
jgi:SsrA-binding protein